MVLVSCTQQEKRWGQIKKPTLDKSEVYGSYTNGCLAGGELLVANQSSNFKLMRPTRNRSYAHPELIQFIKRFSTELKVKNLGMLAISDLSQPRGGPMLSGHASHQIGLDIDIWFKRFSKKEFKEIRLTDLEMISADSVVNQADEIVDDEYWQSSNADVLEIAAADKKVERIFVNYAIKQELCKNHKGEKWLNKIRPWWGHTHHYHIRLSCPDSSPFCKPQKQIEQNDGCDKTLSWWFTEESKIRIKTEPAIKSILSEQCLALLDESD